MILRQHRTHCSNNFYRNIKLKITHTHILQKLIQTNHKILTFLENLNLKKYFFVNICLFLIYYFLINNIIIIILLWFYSYLVYFSSIDNFYKDQAIKLKRKRGTWNLKQKCLFFIPKSQQKFLSKVNTFFKV